MSFKSSWNKLWSAMDRELKSKNMAQRSMQRSLDIINQSLELIKTSKNWETKKSRIAVVINTAQTLIDTCQNKDTVKQMKNMLPQYKAQQIEIHIAALKTKINDCVSKAASLKSYNSKMNAFAKAKEAIADVENNDPLVPREVVDQMKRMVALGQERLNANSN